MPDSDGPPGRSSGRLLDQGRYDAELWLFDTFAMRGQIRQLHRKVVDAAGIRAGRRLLDVGCGTGTLSIPKPSPRTRRKRT